MVSITTTRNSYVSPFLTRGTNLSCEGPAETDDCNFTEPSSISLNDSIHKVCRPDSDAEHIFAVHLGLGKNVFDRSMYTGCHVDSGGGLVGCRHPARGRVSGGDVDDGSVGISTTDIDTDAVCAGGLRHAYGS